MSKWRWIFNKTLRRLRYRETRLECGHFRESPRRQKRSAGSCGICFPGYANLSNVGPAITIPIAGDYEFSVDSVRGVVWSFKHSDPQEQKTPGVRRGS